MVAGDKEKRFRDLFANRVKGAALQGKRRFAGENVEISVDEHFSSNGVEYLVEIDSGNMAKLLVGQYVLLDALRGNDNRTSKFLIVHTYKNYNIVRTLENFHFIKSRLELSLEFMVVHMDTIVEWEGGDIEAFIGLADT